MIIRRLPRSYFTRRTRCKPVPPANRPHRRIAGRLLRCLDQGFRKRCEEEQQWLGEHVLGSRWPTGSTLLKPTLSKGVSLVKTVFACVIWMAARNHSVNASSCCRRTKTSRYTRTLAQVSLPVFPRASLRTAKNWSRPVPMAPPSPTIFVTDQASEAL